MITQIQFDALAALCRLRKESKTFAAVQDVMVCGLTVSESATKHNVHCTSVYSTYKSMIQSVRLVHQAVTGTKA